MANETKTLTVGSDLSILDIFLSSAGVAVDATFVGFELKDAAGTIALSGLPTNPSLGVFKASGVVPGGFQLGTWQINWDIITLANDVAQTTEKFCVDAVNIAIDFTPPEDKTFSIYDAVRLDIGDPESQVFDDTYLERILTKAVRRVNHNLGLSRTNRPLGIPGGFGGPKLNVSPIVVDLTAGTLEPNNDELCDIVIMCMEYIIVSSEVSALKRLTAESVSGPHVATLNSASQDGISVVNADGVQISVSPGRLTSRTQLHRFDVEDKRMQYENAVKAFLARQTGNYSKMIY
jgi:hypothetical protein